MTNPQGRPLTELGLPARVTNPLRRAGIHTLEELCIRTTTEVQGIRWIGARAMKEIQEALAQRGLCLADEPIADVIHCICSTKPVMEFFMGNRRGEMLECPKCSRLLYRSKVTPIQKWYQPEATWPSELKYEMRHCMACQSAEPHIKKVDGSFQCLACLVRECEGR